MSLFLIGGLWLDRQATGIQSVKSYVWSAIHDWIRLRRTFEATAVYFLSNVHSEYLFVVSMDWTNYSNRVFVENWTNYSKWVFVEKMLSRTFNRQCQTWLSLLDTLIRLIKEFSILWHDSQLTRSDLIRQVRSNSTG